MPADWICEDCEQENPGHEVECIACTAPRPAASPYAGYKVARVVSVEAIPKTKLRALVVEVEEGTTVTIVTNARVDAGETRHIVVATIGSIVRIDGEEVEVKKATVGGRRSEGMLVDAPMLGWKGGAAGAAVFLPESYPIGSEPPPSRP
ncbi:hypothetical protein THRCLA_21535 [Thraustotheca clavata]|uniref:RanBP2-type domain-containing protein n=1 Tax=Thraustotheca clavata TaxID=74557 RepID=A0A1V9ZVG2_9STRA|nr:hypothetical protein THRCLA_21535 [Thraustotheca clavata]